MDIYQATIRLPRYPRGFHLITERIAEVMSRHQSFDVGMANLFIKHTSASLFINEDADPSVRSDMELFMTDIADDKAYYRHIYEGSDDMPAHIKSALLGNSLSIPVSRGRLNLGTWQGIYLGEHRDHASGREIVLTCWGSEAAE